VKILDLKLYSSIDVYYNISFYYKDLFITFNKQLKLASLMKESENKDHSPSP